MTEKNPLLRERTSACALLRQFSLSPKKRFSQNFLTDPNVIQKIIQAAKLKAGDYVLEIGPGIGAVTKKLLEKGVYVLAIEKDRELIPILETLASPQLRLLTSDFLDLSLPDILGSGDWLCQVPLEEKAKIKVLSNLPYHLTSRILQKVLPLHEQIVSAIFMMQKEVALRCAALPKSCDYSSLSVFTHMHSIPKRLFDISQHVFYPKPTVTSSVVEFTLRPFAEPRCAPFFFQVVKQAFCHRRKMLHRSLREMLPKEQIKKALFSLGLPENARPQELSPTDFLRFALHFQQKPKNSAKDCEQKKTKNHATDERQIR